MPIILYMTCTALVLVSLRPSWRQYKLWRWKSRLQLKRHIKTLNTIGTGINGFALSKLARMPADAFEYVYGEIDYYSWIALISLTKPNAATVFYDLGSGTGKAVLATAMVFDIKKSCGIELFPNLDQAAKQQLSLLRTNPAYQPQAKNIEFICENFLNTNLNDATIIFISATGLFGATWIALNHHLERLTTSPVIITTSKPLLSKQFQLQHITRVQMSWGVVYAYIQQNVSLPDCPNPMDTGLRR